MPETPDAIANPQTDPAPTTPKATPLAAALGATVERTAVRGALTTLRFDALERETAALAHGAAAHDLGWLGRVAVRGEDRFRWLSGMVTNTVNDLTANGGAWNLLLSAQGRILGDLTVWRAGEGLEMVLDAEQSEKILAHLDRFIIMDDVELTPLSDDSALGLAGPEAAQVLTRLGLPTPTAPMTAETGTWHGAPLRCARGYEALTPHYELWTTAAEIPALWRELQEAGAVPVGATALEALRVAEGIPLYGVDMAERDLPQETAQMRALHFSKGCYLGQEIVERIHARGNVHRHLRQLEIEGPLPARGTELSTTKADGTSAQAGSVTSAAALALSAGERRFALAMIRAEAELRPQSLTYTTEAGTGTARILSTPPAIEPKRD